MLEVGHQHNQPVLGIFHVNEVVVHPHNLSSFPSHPYKIHYILLLSNHPSKLIKHTHNTRLIIEFYNKFVHQITIPIPMAQERKLEMGLVLVTMAMIMLFTGAAAQSSSCTSVLVNLSPCVDYITGNSSKPSSGCCSQLASAVRSQPQCLCQVLNGRGSSLGININQTQALALPSACNVKTPPISQCKAATPAESPNSDPSGTGSGTVPANGDGSSSGNSIKLSIPLLFIAFVASYASTFRTY